MVWIRKKLVNNFFILLIIVFSCGFYSTKGSLPVHIKSIHVSSILNESPEHSITDRLLDEINNTLIDENILDVVNGKSLFKTNINTSAIYGTESDINIDGIDNDGDNLIDGNDSDEFGPPREGAIRIAIEKISREILNQITSTW